MKTIVLALNGLLLLCHLTSFSQDSTFTLLFMGDIMGHDSQITSAKESDETYNYKPVFKYLESIISKADVAIANLEVTLAGPPFKGYPQFSSPDALAIAAKEAGITVMGTANNHSVDRGGKGIERIIRILDSLKIEHMGTYASHSDKSGILFCGSKKTVLKLPS